MADRASRRAQRLAAERRRANRTLARDLAALVGWLAGVVLLLVVCAILIPVIL